MRRLLSVYGLLWLCCAPGRACCQAPLTLAELLSLQAANPLQVDAYLINRGWHMIEAPAATNDSTFTACWVYVRPPQKRQAELLLFKEGNKSGQLYYSTPNRVTFDAVKKQVLDYPMEPYTDDVVDGAVRRQFVGKTYSVWTVLFRPKEEAVTWYGFLVNQHGLTKYFTPDTSGSLQPVWVSKDGKVLVKTLFNSK